MQTSIQEAESHFGWAERVVSERKLSTEVQKAVGYGGPEPTAGGVQGIRDVAWDWRINQPQGFEGKEDGSQLGIHVQEQEWPSLLSPAQRWN